MSRTDAILRRLLTLHPNKLIDLKLDRVERLLEDLGRPQDRLPPVIHVAGTNGKGSTIAYLRAMLEAADKRVHVYTSPHLVAFRERVRLAGTLVSARRLNDALERCEAVNAGKPITFFEITTAAALLLFSEVDADYLLLEVGLGGRFDATNVIDHPFGTVITPVSIDHVEFLGSSLAGIAREKAGILKRAAPAVIARQPDEAQTAILREANELDVSPFVGGEDFDGYAQRGRLVYQDEVGLLDLPLPALAGAFQVDNAAVAIAAVRHFGLPVSERDIAAGLRTVSWPARMMPIRSGKLRALLPEGHELWLDGGHNESGGAAVATALEGMQAKQDRPLVMIMGVLANKDVKGYLGNFPALAPEIIGVRIPGEASSRSARGVVDEALKSGLRARPARGLRSALRAAATVPDARVVICGSLYLAGHLLAENGTPPA